MIDFDRQPHFSRAQVMWLEDLFVNKLVRVWAPKRDKEEDRCHGCIVACEELFKRIRSLRDEE